MTFSEFRQFLATTSSFRQYSPSFSRSFSAPTSGPTGIRGCGLGDFTANSVGRLAGDGKSTGKEAIGYFERLFQRDSNTVEGDFDVFTSPRLAVCRQAAAVPPIRINEGNSSTTFDIRRVGKRKQDEVEKKGVKKEIGIEGVEDFGGYLKKESEEEGEGDGEGEREGEKEGEGENKATGIKNPRYSFFPDEDDKFSFSDVYQKTDRSNEQENGESKFIASRGNITERRTYSRHFKTSEKVSPKSKRVFYGDRRNFYTDNAQVGSRGVGEVEGGVGGVGGVGEIVEKRREDDSEEKGGEKGGNGIRGDIPNELWMRLTDEDEEEEMENDAKPSPSYNHTMSHLDKLEGTDGMRSL